MINAILIFPIIACLLMLLIKNRKFYLLMINLYAILHFIITLFLIKDCDKYLNHPYFAVDGINSLFLLVLSFIFLMVAIYNNGYIKTFDVTDRRIRNYSLMILAFVLSMTGTILSTNLGLSWVFVEATTLSSAYLIYFNKTKHAIEAAWKYVFICSIGIALAFVGIILLNIATGAINTLNFNELYNNAQQFDVQWLKVAFLFMLFGFGAKMGLAPIHFWLPDAHSEAPSPISALLSATLLNSAFLVIIRIFKIIAIADCTDYARIILFIMGFMSLFITAVFLNHIKNYKRMLAYSSIENMGILVIGMALGNMAYYAVILHLIGHSLAKASFFLTSGNILELFGTKRIKSISGMIHADGKTAWLWIASFLAICAFPTSLLFISEFLIIKTMIVQGHYILCALFVILLTIILYGLAKVILKMSFGILSEDKINLITENKKKISMMMCIPQYIMLVLVFVLGIYIPSSIDNIIKLAIGGF